MKMKKVISRTSLKRTDKICVIAIMTWRVRLKKQMNYPVTMNYTTDELHDDGNDLMFDPSQLIGHRRFRDDEASVISGKDERKKTHWTNLRC